MRVYRYENSKGYGPYTTLIKEVYDRYEPKSILYRHRPESRSHPLPSWEGLSFTWYSSDRCGFASRKQMLKWFNDRERRGIRKYGFYLSIYEVPEESVQIGKKQCVFDSEKATLVRRYGKRK